MDERLQTGDNPISVSVNAIPLGNVQIGSEFADAQGRSVVIAFDVGQPEPDVSECPPPSGGTTTTKPQATTTTTGGRDDHDDGGSDHHHPADVGAVLGQRLGRVPAGGGSASDLDHVPQPA